MELTRRTLLGVAYGMSGNGQPSEIWVDQDGGWEDIAAIAILLRSPDVKVMGIATTPGIADSQTANGRVRQLLDTLQERDAKLVADFPAKASILSTGPLTRVARLIANNRAPASIIWMGGAIHAKGNARNGAEWNAAASPRALKTVLASSVPFTICPLDLTNQFASDASVVPASQAPVIEEIRKAYLEKERCWWDELTAAYIAAPALFSKDEMKLAADEQGRLHQTPRGRKVAVLTACDVAGFRNLLGRSLRF